MKSLIRQLFCISITTLPILILTFCFISLTCADIQFEEVSQQAGITRIGESWGNAWGGL